MDDVYTLRYSGGDDSDAGQMGYYDAASVILAFGDLVGIVSRAAYGKDARVRTVVTTPKDGSIAFDFMLYAGGFLTTLAGGPSSPRELWELFNEAIELWRFLRGKQPANIERGPDGTVQVTNINGDVGTFNQTVHIIADDPKAGDAAERVFKRPLQESARRVEVSSKAADRRLSVGRDDAGSFTDVSRGDVVTDTEFELALEILSANFIEGNKWRFSDGSQKFAAAIEDPEFLKRVDDGEPFSKGDSLVVLMGFLQEKVKGRLRTTRTIRHVISHDKPGENASLFSDD